MWVIRVTAHQITISVSDRQSFVKTLLKITQQFQELVVKLSFQLNTADEMRTPDIFPGLFFTVLSTLIFFSGLIFLIWHIYKSEKSNNNGGDDHDGDGGISWDVDAPLDLPPGIYTLPPEPVAQS